MFIMGRRSTLDKYLGKKIGGITILKSLGLHNGRTRVLCHCGECSKEFKATFHNVYRGNYKSCGCKRTAINSRSYKWKGHGEISGSYFIKLIKGAEDRNLIFQITIEQIWDLFLRQNRKCIFTGIELKFPLSRSDTTQTASLDRINSSKGYVLDNVQWVHKDINIMKQSMNDEEFLDWIKIIYNHSCKQ